MIHTILFLCSLFLIKGVVPEAEARVWVVPGYTVKWKYPPVLASYYCNPAGWLQATFNFADNSKQTKSIWMGSYAACSEQAQLLRKNKTRLNRPTFVAACSATPTYLVKWIVDPIRKIKSFTPQFYQSSSECLKDAVELMNQSQ